VSNTRFIGLRLQRTLNLRDLVNSIFRSYKEFSPGWCLDAPPKRSSSDVPKQYVHTPKIKSKTPRFKIPRTRSRGDSLAAATTGLCIPSRVPFERSPGAGNSSRAFLVSLARERLMHSRVRHLSRSSFSYISSRDFWHTRYTPGLSSQQTGAL